VYEETLTGWPNDKSVQKATSDNENDYKHLNFYKYISNVCSSSYFISVLSATFALFLTQKLPRPLQGWFQIRLCQFHSNRQFFSQSSACSKLLDSSRYSLNNQHHLSSKFTSKASNSKANQF